MALKPLLFGTAFALIAGLSPLAPTTILAKDKTGGPPPINQTEPEGVETPPDLPQTDEGPTMPEGDEMPPAEDGPAVNTSDAEQMMKDYLIGENGRTLDVLDQRFPDELDRIGNSLDALLTGAQANFDREAALESFADVIAAERMRYTQSVVNAPDASLIAAITSLRDFVQKVYDQEGAETCGQFANDGSKVLYFADIAANYTAELDQQSALFLTAVADARDTPEAHGSATDADLLAVFDKMRKDGGTQHQIDVLAAQDPSDPEVCPALIEMMSALATLEGPEGARSRAYFLPEFVGY